LQATDINLQSLRRAPKGKGGLAPPGTLSGLDTSRAAKLVVGIIENLPDAVVVFDPGGSILEINSAAPRIFGYDPEELVGRKVDILVQEEDFSLPRDAFSGAPLAAAGNIADVGPREVTGRRKDGTTFPLELGVGRMELDGRTLLIGTFRDISRRKGLESEAAEKSALLATTFDIIAQGYAVYDRHLRLIQYNAQFETIFGFPKEFLHRGISRWEIVHFRAERGDYGPGNIEEIVARLCKKAGSPGENSRERTLSTGITYIYHRKSLPDGGCVITYTDITDLRCAEREAASKAALLERTMEAMAQACVVFDASGTVIAFNRHFEKLFDFPEGFLGPGRTFGDVIRYRLEHGPTIGSVSDSGDPEEEIAVHLSRLKKYPSQMKELSLADGRTYIYSRTGMIDGCIVCTYTDVTAIKKTERALRDTETLLRLVTDASPVLIAYIDANRTIRFANKAFAARHGLTPEEIVGMHQTEYWGNDKHEHLREEIARTLAGEITMNEGRRQYPDGSFHYHVTSRAPHFDESGKVVGYFNIILDITDQKRAEEALQQAQKMEAVGQLTGGVAHDFNNLLAVIQGSAELLAERGGADDRLLQCILRAANRGAELTRRLLAFSRRQPLHPQPVDLGALVSNLSDVLKRTLGETIEVRTPAAPELWFAQADPGQVETALLNLAINARDAMPEGGKLRIGCSNARVYEKFAADNPEIAPGDYVVLAVADDGTGMPEHVRARVFEPFYTTKNVGQGSGLGLSMVYGFAKQSGGSVTVESTVGRGTMVKLYLPRANGTTAPRPAEDGEVHRGRGERILVLEDDADVRSLVEVTLKRLGYRVKIAATAGEAVDVLACENVDLLLSDVVLAGGTSGPEVAAYARAAQPELKVIFMSGYAADADTSEASIGKADVLLSKPFQKQNLARALRKALR
jgi:PAS domain S-box-containing protein